MVFRNRDDGYGNDFIYGTFTLNARTHIPDASGSGFTIAKPIHSMGAISGSQDETPITKSPL